MKLSKLSAKKYFVIFTTCLAVITFSFWERSHQVEAGTQETYKNLEAFSNVLNLLQQNYVEEIDSSEVIEGAIKGMLATLDPHSSYMKPDDFQELKIETKGSFSGIGIEITMKDGILTVVSPIEGTPAFKMGVQAQDKILKIDDESTKDMSLMEAVKKLRGPKGTKVTISIHREGLTELKDITIIRNVIPLISVKSKTLAPGYGYIRIRNFQSKTTKEFKKALVELTEDGDLQGLVLDLRSNPGGLLDQAVKISDIFLEEGMIVFTKGRIKDQNMEFKAHANGDKYNFPIIVLVNEGSASASEIVAGALQDHQRALILGAQTFGKGSVQTIIPMTNGAGLRLTTARYYTPNGTSIQATGITPDIVIPTQLITPKAPAEDEKKKMKFLREKDLKHHFENGDEEEKNDKEATAEDESEEAKKQKEIEQDNQLHQALMLLKGLSVFSKLTE
ncbi:MAG: PDZ domain-containing protein [Desulfovibrionaceae bacterium]|jgi:carboxyl-terminal processing protease|nr:PDZ domain-containing protein [Desulfovibrionaceae bacterium]